MKISKIGKMQREQYFREALEAHDIPEIAEYLCNLDDPLPVEYAQRLATAILDPKRKAAKPGTKPLATSSKKQHRQWMRNNFIILSHCHLKSDPEWKAEMAEVITNADPDCAATEVKDIVCKLHGIGSRAYDDIIAQYRAKAIPAYLDLLSTGNAPDKAKEKVCQWYDVRPVDFDKTLAKHMKGENE